VSLENSVLPRAEQIIAFDCRPASHLLLASILKALHRLPLFQSRFGTVIALTGHAPCPPFGLPSPMTAFSVPGCQGRLS